MAKYDWLSLAPVLVVDRCSIFDCYRAHVIFTFSSLVDVEEGAPLDATRGFCDADSMDRPQQWPAAREASEEPAPADVDEEGF